MTTTEQSIDLTKCKKCAGEMCKGVAMGQTIKGGIPDFIGQKEVVTYSAGGPGKIIDCLKCASCGWSTTIPAKH